MKTIVAAALLSAMTTASAGTVYTCKAYNGAMFYSAEHCAQRNALIDHIDTVADVPWPQQVQQADNARNQRHAEARRPQPQQNTLGVIGPNQSPECKALDDEIRQLDEWARHPQYAASQTRIAERRRQARDRQFRMRC